eukprot:5551285-Pleurochrysis_carterae.AAC.1
MRERLIRERACIRRCELAEHADWKRAGSSGTSNQPARCKVSSDMRTLAKARCAAHVVTRKHRSRSRTHRKRRRRSAA